MEGLIDYDDFPQELWENVAQATTLKAIKDVLLAFDLAEERVGGELGVDSLSRRIYTAVGGQVQRSPTHCI